MNYKKIYNQIIKKAKSENRCKNDGTYYELHHIKPKCLGGKDNKQNLVLLTAKEHFLCHKLLVNINPKEKSLIFALWMMSNGSNIFRKKYLNISSREYEYSRNLYSESRKGFTYSEESKNKMSESQKNKIGNKNSFYGRKHSEEAKKKMSERAKNRVVSEETKNKMSAVRKGKKHSEQAKINMSNAMKGIKKTQSHIDKMRKNKLGKKHSEESKIKISEKLKGIIRPIFTEEHRKKISESLKKYHKKHIIKDSH